MVRQAKIWVSQKDIEPLVFKKSKFISSPEQNYFSHFAMRYPVLPILKRLRQAYSEKSTAELSWGPGRKIQDLH